MRELEFLPAWYPDLRQRRRLVNIQAWLTIGVALIVTCWLVGLDQAGRSELRSLAALRGELSQSRNQLRERSKLVEAEAQLRRQLEVQAKLGQHIESARLLGALAEAMPSNMSLVNMEVEKEETAQEMTNLARAALKDPNNPPKDRRLKVKLSGVSPTDVDLATFITELNKMPFLDHVLMIYAKDRREQGHVMREFELSFSINLNFAGA